MTLHIARRLLWVLCLLLSAGGVTAGIIDTIDVIDQPDEARIQINFAVPLQYINHAPESSGDELHIQVQPLGSNVFSIDSALSQQQTVSTRTTDRVPLIDVTYNQSSSSRGVITVRFSRLTRFSVLASPDRRHVTVLVPLSPIALPEKTPPTPTEQPISSNEAPATKTIPAVSTPDYVINLRSSISPVSVPRLEFPEGSGNLVVYTARFSIENRVWNRLRVGFFATEEDAEIVLNVLKPNFPRAWIARAGAREIRSALGQARQRSRTPTPIGPTLPRVPNDKIQAIMEQARDAMTAGNTGRAVQLYTKVLSYPENPFQKDALEFLGLARERKGQLAHAIQEYKRYLELYPQSEGAERVQQRLAGLTTSRKAPGPRKLGAKRPAKEAEWDVYGGLSQFYRRDASTTDVDGTEINQSSLSTDLDVTTRRRSENFDMQSRFTGSYLKDFLDNGVSDETSVSSLFLDVKDLQRGLSGRVGRQSRNTGGVLGRFDGLLVSYKLNESITVNGVTGFPVFSTDDSVKTDRYLYGISADLGTFANAWDFNTFFIEQKNNDILDRRAIGGEARYFDPVRSLLTHVDYDISFESVNTFIFLGTWTLPSRTSINASFDYRNSPILTTSNAIQGQNVRTLDQLLDTFSEKELKQLAEDRSGKNTTGTVGFSHPFTEKFQMSGDVTVSNMSETETSGGVEGIPGTGNEYFYNVQFIGSSLLKSGDISILGLRYSDTSTATISTLTVNTRYPVARDWRVNPRFRLDYRDNDRDGSTQWIAGPSLRMDYRWRKLYRFEAEGGGEWSSRDLADENEDSSSWYFSVGYRADF